MHVHGRGIVDLAPRFKERHPFMTIIGVIAAVALAVVAVVGSSTRAEVSDFYPSTCLGTWKNPSDAAGPPPNGAANLQFTDAGSAVFSASGTQIFCGGFVPPGSSGSGMITNVGLTFYWQVGNGVVAAPAGGGTADASGAAAVAAPTSTLISTSTGATSSFAPEASSSTASSTPIATSSAQSGAPRAISAAPSSTASSTPIATSTTPQFSAVATTTTSAEGGMTSSTSTATLGKAVGHIVNDVGEEIDRFDRNP